MHEGHVETKELGHEGFSLRAASTNCLERPECMEEKADGRMPLLA